MSKSKYLIQLLLLIPVLLAVVSALSLYMVLRPAMIISTITPADLGLEYEEVTFVTEDGIELAGWFIPSEGGGETGKTIIAMHGYPADKGNILSSVSDLQDDYNLFLFDFRYLGESKGAYSTAGAKEVMDLYAAIDLLESDYGQARFGLWGFSVGGAVAIMGAEGRSEIEAVYAESSYSNLGDLSRELHRAPFIGRIIGLSTNSLARLFLGLNPGNVSPEDAVTELDIPLMLVHSRDDSVIDISHGHRIADAGGDNVEFIELDGFDHGQITSDSTERMRDFFRSNF